VGGDLSEIEIAASLALVFARGRARKFTQRPLQTLAAFRLPLASIGPPSAPFSP
jgi:hypothetical protein